METFSVNLFYLSGWGQVFSGLVFFAAVGVGLACGIWAAHKLDDKPKIVQAGGFALGLVTAGLLVLLLMPGDQGEVTALSLAEVDGERVIVGDFTWMASGGRGAGRRVYASRRFRVHDGALLGELRTNGGILWRACEGAVSHGRLRLCLKGGDMKAYDEGTLEEIGDLSELLDTRYGPEGYRVQGFEDGRLMVQRRDGVEDALTPAELGLPAEPLESINLLATCPANARRQDSEVEGLLRATPCPLPGGQLVLHRESAFGDGAHLVSLQDPSTRWTLPLEPWVDPSSNELRLLAPRRVEGEVSFWLLREKVSLVEVVVDASSGTPIRAEVVF